MTKKEYEDDLKRRQKEHLDNVSRFQDNQPWQPCLHDSCPECVGTGIKHDGSMCVHYLSCSCPKCSPWCNGESTPVITFNSRNVMFEFAAPFEMDHHTSPITDNTRTIYNGSGHINVTPGESRKCEEIDSQKRSTEL